MMCNYGRVRARHAKRYGERSNALHVVLTSLYCFYMIIFFSASNDISFFCMRCVALYLCTAATDCITSGLVNATYYAYYFYVRCQVCWEVSIHSQHSQFAYFLDDSMNRKFLAVIKMFKKDWKFSNFICEIVQNLRGNLVDFFKFLMKKKLTNMNENRRALIK